MKPPIVEHHAGQFCRLDDSLTPFFGVSKCGLSIYPLITAHNGLSCELEIWMSVYETRLLTPGGDIDNRIKVIFDALRMPRVEQEIPETLRGIGSTDLYCLLEDDSLIRKFSVEAEESLSSPLVEELSVRVKLSMTNSSNPTLLQL
jgi:hypothetical protein